MKISEHGVRHKDKIRSKTIVKSRVSAHVTNKYTGNYLH